VPCLELGRGSFDVGHGQDGIRNARRKIWMRGDISVFDMFNRFVVFGTFVKFDGGV
jgi:hypothetical protein